MKINELEAGKIYASKNGGKYRVNEMKTLYVLSCNDYWGESKYKYNKLLKVDFTEFDATTEYFEGRGIKEDSIFFIIDAAITKGYYYLRDKGWQ